MNGFDYERWLTSMNELADRLTAGFQEKHGYPPGENKVTPATGPVPDGVDELPAPLAEFYRHVAEVSLPDLHNAYFISDARHTVSGRDGRQIVRVEGPFTSDVVTFGADGGGTHFALGLPDGSPVYVLPPGAVDRRGVYDDWNSRVQVAAATLPEFLTKLHDFFASEISGR